MFIKSGLAEHVLLKSLIVIVLLPKAQVPTSTLI